MRFLTLLQFIDKIALDRGLQKRTVGGMGHQHHPGQHHHSHRNKPSTGRNPKASYSGAPRSRPAAVMMAMIGVIGP